jgi:hypothetical protein
VSGTSFFNDLKVGALRGDGPRTRESPPFDGLPLLSVAPRRSGARMISPRLVLRAFLVEIEYRDDRRGRPADVDVIVKLMECSLVGRVLNDAPGDFDKALRCQHAVAVWRNGYGRAPYYPQHEGHDTPHGENDETPLETLHPASHYLVPDLPMKSVGAVMLGTRGF